MEPIKNLMGDGRTQTGDDKVSFSGPLLWTETVNNLSLSQQQQLSSSSTQNHRSSVFSWLQQQPTSISRGHPATANTLPLSQQQRASTLTQWHPAMAAQAAQQRLATSSHHLQPVMEQQSGMLIPSNYLPMVAQKPSGSGLQWPQQAWTMAQQQQHGSSTFQCQWPFQSRTPQDPTPWNGGAGARQASSSYSAWNLYPKWEHAHNILQGVGGDRQNQDRLGSDDYNRGQPVYWDNTGTAWPVVMPCQTLDWSQVGPVLPAVRGETFASEGGSFPAHHVVRSASEGFSVERALRGAPSYSRSPVKRDDFEDCVVGSPNSSGAINLGRSCQRHPSLPSSTAMRVEKHGQQTIELGDSLPHKRVFRLEREKGESEVLLWIPHLREQGTAQGTYVQSRMAGDDSICQLELGRGTCFDVPQTSSRREGGATEGPVEKKRAVEAQRPGIQKLGRRRSETPPICQVDDCAADLLLCQDYHRRHKVCDAHSKAERVLLGGIEQRFCQQCSRFELLEKFEHAKRSCAKRLEGHNLRRRKSRLPPAPVTGIVANVDGSSVLQSLSVSAEEPGVSEQTVTLNNLSSMGGYNEPCDRSQLDIVAVHRSLISSQESSGIELAPDHFERRAGYNQERCNRPHADPAAIDSILLHVNGSSVAGHFITPDDSEARNSSVSSRKDPNLSDPRANSFGGDLDREDPGVSGLEYPCTWLGMS